MGVYLMGVYLMGVYLMGVYLMGVSLGVHLTGRAPHWACTSLGVRLLGVICVEASDFQFRFLGKSPYTHEDTCTQEADTPEPKAKVVRIEAPEPAKAPVARMTEAQDPASATEERVSEAQEHAKALMAWMERNARVSRGPSGGDEET